MSDKPTFKFLNAGCSRHILQLRRNENHRLSSSIFRSFTAIRFSNPANWREHDASFHRWCKLGMHWGNSQFSICKALHHLAMQLRHGYMRAIDIFEMSAKLLCPIAICRELDPRGSEDFAVTIRRWAGSIARIQKIQYCGIRRIQIGPRLGCKVRRSYFFDRTVLLGY